MMEESKIDEDYIDPREIKRRMKGRLNNRARRVQPSMSADGKGLIHLDWAL